MHSLDPISPPEPVDPLAVTPPELAAPDLPVSNEVDLVDVLLVVVMSALSFLVLGSIAAGIFLFTHRGLAVSSQAIEDAVNRNAFFIVPTQVLVYAVILGFMAVLVSVRHKTSLFEAIHWNVPDSRRIGNALMLGAALALFSDLGDVVLRRWIPDSLPITEYFKDRPSALLLGAFGVLVAPLIEELIFRGFLYPALARWTGAIPSVVLTALAFAMLHGAQLGYSWAPLLLILVVGTALTVVRMETNSVATCVLVHMTYNFALLAQTYALTHGFRQMQGT